MRDVDPPPPTPPGPPQPRSATTASVERALTKRDLARYETLQRGLAEAWRATRCDGPAPHVLIALPSYTLYGAVQEHYALRIPALEQRQLVGLLSLARHPGCRMVFVCSRPPERATLDYLASFLPAPERTSALDRLHVLPVEGPTSRSLAANLLHRTDLLGQLASLLDGLPALIDPWIVTPDEVAVALRLGVPLAGSPPGLCSLGCKSGSRTLYRDLGVPIPPGREHVRSLDDVVDALRAIRDEAAPLRAVVVKLDDSTSGDGNRIVETGNPVPRPDRAEDVRLVQETLPDWFLADLRRGGIVEALVEGATVTSPSVQLQIEPGGQVTVTSTHEQVLSGPTHQVYDGCRFPANPAYARRLAEYGLRIGRELARRGAVGHVGVDFMARENTVGEWEVMALETNLRRAGTTHPFALLQALVPGAYDPVDGRYRLPDGSTRSYASTDNLVDPRWTGLPVQTAIAAIDEAGLRFDPAQHTGVVLHMLAGLAIDGRLGLTSIGVTPDHAAALHEFAVAALQDALTTASRQARATASPAGP